MFLYKAQGGRQHTGDHISTANSFLLDPGGSHFEIGIEGTMVFDRWRDKRRQGKGHKDQKRMHGKLSNNITL